MSATPGSALSLKASLALAAILMMLGLIFTPVINAGLNPRARKPWCQSNLKQIGTGVSIYTVDYDDTLPPAQSWWNACYPYIKNPSIQKCPSDARPEQSRFGSYAWNDYLDRLPMERVSDPAEQAAVFDAETRSPNMTSRGGAFSARHMDSANLLYLDGHVKGQRSTFHLFLTPIPLLPAKP